MRKHVARLAPFDKLRVLSPIEGRVARLAGLVDQSRVSRKSRESRMENEVCFTKYGLQKETRRIAEPYTCLANSRPSE